MGVFSSFFDRRRRRESAVSQDEPESTPPPSDAEPVGQPFADVGQPINLNMGSGPVDIGGLLGMIGTAIQTGQFQVQQAENQVLDLRGSGLREEIMEAMRQSGVDSDAQVEINAAQYGDLQQKILEALSNHGVDVQNGGGTPPAPDSDGDGRPG